MYGECQRRAPATQRFRLSLRGVNRMLERVEDLANRPTMHGWQGPKFRASRVTAQPNVYPFARAPLHPCILSCTVMAVACGNPQPPAEHGEYATRSA